MAAKKASTSVEVVLGSASKKLAVVSKDLQTTVTQLVSLSTTSEDLSDEIASKEEKIKALGVEFNEKLRAHQVEFDLKVKEDALKVAEGILASQHLVSVPKQELDVLRKEFTDLQTSFDDRVKAETGKITGIMKSQFETERKLLEAQFQTKEAENIASIRNLSAQVSELKEQVKQWQAAADAQRQASVEMAKAGQIGTLNVGSQGNGR